MPELFNYPLDIGSRRAHTCAHTPVLRALTTELKYNMNLYLNHEQINIERAKRGLEPLESALLEHAREYAARDAALPKADDNLEELL